MNCILADCISLSNCNIKHHSPSKQVIWTHHCRWSASPFMVSVDIQVWITKPLCSLLPPSLIPRLPADSVRPLCTRSASLSDNPAVNLWPCVSPAITAAVIRRSIPTLLYHLTWHAYTPFLSDSTRCDILIKLPAPPKTHSDKHIYMDIYIGR